MFNFIFSRPKNSKVVLHKEAVVNVDESAELEGYHKRNGDKNGEVSQDASKICK